MLHPKLKQALKDTQRRLFDEGKLLTVDQLKGYYAAFRTRFNIERLRSMDGETLLNTMHGRSQSNPNALTYWLEFKNDDEFPTRRFGGIAGGSALKFGVYQNATTGEWMVGQGTRPVEIVFDQALEIARSHRDQLLRGVALLEALPNAASDEAYAALQTALNEQMTTIALTAWGHKYLSLLFPDKLDEYHIEAYQRFHLVKVLHPNIPAAGSGRYIAAGHFVRIAQELDMPMNHLTTILNEMQGNPYHYWSVTGPDSRDPFASLVTERQSQIQDGFVAIRWEKLGDLSHLTHYKPAKDSLRQQMSELYPKSTSGEQQGVFNFVTGILHGDRLLVIEPSGRTVLGICEVIGRYQFVPPVGPHRLPVKWLSTEEWQLPHEERFAAVAREIRIYANQVEIERHILEGHFSQPFLLPDVLSSLPPARLVSPIVTHEPTKPAFRLTGLPGRIQSILERKGQVILYGPPGTGKTYWAELSACELSARQVFGKPFSDLTPDQQQGIFGTADSTVQLCSFHPAYGYEDFLEGYRPQLLSGQMTFVRQNGIFKQLCKRAREDANNNYYLIIDEINRGDIPRIFGELLTLLEKDKRGKSIMLPLSGEPFAVPANVFVIGTMNTADRSIALLDTALRRRFGFVELLPDPSQLGSVILKGIPLRAWLKQLNDRILDHVGRDARNLQIGHAYFLEGGQPLKDFAKFARILREDIIPLLEEYCYEDYEALEKILGSSLVDKHRQIIRQDLFEAGREEELAEAVLQPTPDLTTDEAVIAAEVEAEAALADVDVDDAEDNA